MAHGTLTALWKGGRYEVTTLRGEGAYSDGRRPDPVVFIDDLDGENTLCSIPGALRRYRRVSRERVREEWPKLPKAPEPSQGFELMRGTRGHRI